MQKIQLKIPTNILVQIGMFFSFFFFNTVLFALRSVLIGIAFLFIYYTCLGIQKTLLKI